MTDIIILPVLSDINIDPTPVSNLTPIIIKDLNDPYEHRNQLDSSYTKLLWKDDLEPAISAKRLQLFEDVAIQFTDVASENNNSVIDTINAEIEARIADIQNLQTVLKSMIERYNETIRNLKNYADTVDNKVEGLADTVSANATTAANATADVAQNLADYKTANDEAVESAAAKGQQGITDAATALAYAKGLETSLNNKCDAFDILVCEI